MENNIIVFDLETTGTSITKDRIVQISCILCSPDLEVIEIKEMLINPEMEIPKDASDVHHILDEHVKDKPTFKRISSSLLSYLDGRALAGYNIRKFDVPLLMEEFARCGISWIPGTIIDSCNIFHEKEKRDLTAAVKFYAGEDIENAHDATGDNLSTIKVLKGQMSRYSLNLEDASKIGLKENQIDIAGKLILIDGVPCYSFGKSAKIPVKQDRGFGEWMLKNDFPIDTKNKLKELLK